MIVSEYGKTLLRSTCCHSVNLQKDGQSFVGIYNRLSYWGRVEDGMGNCVEELSTEWEDPDPNYPDDEGYLPNFSLMDFQSAGYDIIR